MPRAMDMHTFRDSLSFLIVGLSKTDFNSMQTRCDQPCNTDLLVNSTIGKKENCENWVGKKHL